jgi:hypothetical protein
MYGVGQECVDIGVENIDQSFQNVWRWIVYTKMHIRESRNIPK